MRLEIKLFFDVSKLGENLDEAEILWAALF